MTLPTKANAFTHFYHFLSKLKPTPVTTQLLYSSLHAQEGESTPNPYDWRRNCPQTDRGADYDDECHCDLCNWVDKYITYL